MRGIGSLVIACALAACGGDGAASVDAGSDASSIDGATVFDAGALVDAGPLADAQRDDADAGPGKYGAPSTTYPAFVPTMGVLKSAGGPVLTAPVLVTITWPSDGFATLLEDFGDRIGGTRYWHDTVSEYGVGPAVSGAPNHVRLATAAPAEFGDQDAIDMITANAGGVLPALTSQTVYLFYLPPNTSNPSVQCQGGLGGYHTWATIRGTNVAYSIMPRCGTLADLTHTASHEIGEAATDPFFTAWDGFTDATKVFAYWQRGYTENGDACEFYPDARYAEQAPFAYSVQRLWSNTAAAAGHSPCQPFDDPYFNVTPLGLEDITVHAATSDGGTTATTMKAYRARVGQTITFAVGFYSDRPTSGPWTVAAFESNPLSHPSTGRLALDVDINKLSGINGEKTIVTVTVKAVAPGNIEMLTLESTLGATKHYMPVLIISE